MSTVHKLKQPTAPADPVFELSDLGVGSRLEFHSRSGVVIERTIAALFRNWKLSRKGTVSHETDVLKFDDGYLVQAGYAWRSVQWRLAQ